MLWLGLTEGGCLKELLWWLLTTGDGDLVLNFPYDINFELAIEGLNSQIDGCKSKNGMFKFAIKYKVLKYY